MSFIKVKWKHSIQSEPVLLYSELDDQRFEVRKVEIFSDGHFGYANSQHQSGGTRLGLVPVPSLIEIASDPEFEPFEISYEEFERVWGQIHQGN